METHRSNGSPRFGETGLAACDGNAVLDSPGHRQMHLDDRQNAVSEVPQRRIVAFVRVSGQKRPRFSMRGGLLVDVATIEIRVASGTKIVNQALVPVVEVPRESDTHIRACKRLLEFLRRSRVIVNHLSREVPDVAALRPL